MQESEIPPSQRDRQLPMILHFRGDEELLDAFCIDAEQAMEWLGIKRSRLTQISGRELRVGRVRKDRYVRPVYRESDLRDYQEWTRATATHQSSSKAIEQAIDSLDDRFNDLFVVLHERLEQFQARETAILGDTMNGLRTQLRHQLDALLRDINPIEAAIAQLPTKAWQRQQFSRIHAHSETMAASQAETSQRLELFHQDLRENLVSLQQLRREWREQVQSIQGGQQAATERLESGFEDMLQLTITSIFEKIEVREDELARAENTRSRRVPRRKLRQPRSYMLC
jgi:hypothetical protein